MRLKVCPDDFYVEERIALPLAPGPFTLYRIRKVGVTTLAVQAGLAQGLGLSRRDVVFPAQKDRQAVAVQFASVRGEGPAHLRGEGWEAERVGRAPRPLSPHDLQGNAFTLTLRHLGQDEVPRLRSALERRPREGLPNYFDSQRFGSCVPGEGCIGKALLLGDGEKALRLFLATPLPGEGRRVRAFKTLARQHWGQWERLLPHAPRGPLRSVLTYLKDHPTAFRQAVDRIAPALLSLFLSAYQAWLWNCAVGRWLRALLEPTGAVVEGLTIAGCALPLYEAWEPDLRERLRKMSLPLPHHKMSFPDHQAERSMAETLAQEGLALKDLKARHLTHAYLGRGERPLLLFPADLRVGEAQPDDRFPGRWKVRIAFALPPGSYATLVVKGAGILAGVPLEGEPAVTAES
ncbi:MAG: tRNA pseudouridine(13) synthase TruD [Dehalococcoidia bacterium]|nr:tRNA pseudouridine(13) synthase TruD [Dehalococcoidia bacterium]MDW8119981.1 tRNA pseudouridine(13) synthase TruD [Chloroflexota bacterium]